ncbi:hypothetical protein QC763_0015990 [Podospora pseudopauciseta]|uniref:Stc1 domain-containing protein n=1 Tax=Podospora pseudopauciseta TaxID=2093780 RepID=A0ABR0I0G4_9PEZI|nr:hypothetical protein QC763_0015990 [Podospora pseudopauciseta]
MNGARLEANQYTSASAALTASPAGAHSCFLCGQLHEESYQRLHAGDEFARSSLCVSCRERYELWRQQPIFFTCYLETLASHLNNFLLSSK